MDDQPRFGTGPGAIAADGSPVDLYAALPVDERSASIVHGAVPAGATILELGAGTGRVTRPLRRLGHPVVAVDQSAEMLAHITDAETVCSSIEELDLGRAFDVVLMMSYLVSYVPRRRLLDACRRHVADGGAVVIQRDPPEVFDEEKPRRWERFGVDFHLMEVVPLDAQRKTITIEYRIGDRAWRHTFTSRRLGDEELPGMLAESGLRFVRFLDEKRSWIVAEPVSQT